MLRERPELAAFALAAVVVAGAVVLAVTGHAVPSWFPILALTGVGAGAGLAPSPAQGAASSTDTLNYVSDTVDGVAAAVDAVQADVTALKRRSVIGPATATPAPTGDTTSAPPTAPIEGQSVAGPVSPPAPPAAP